jgi:MFS family permease
MNRLAPQMLSDSNVLIDSDGQRIPPEEVQRAMRINVAAGCFGMLWMAMSINMALPMFLEAIGCSGFIIGLMTAVRMLAVSAQIPSAFIAERLHSRKRFWAATAMINRVLWFPVALLALIWHPEAVWIPLTVVALVGLSDAIGNASAAPWFSWMAELIPESQAGRFWGVRQSIITAVSLVGMWAAGAILDYFRTPTATGVGTTSPTGFAIVFALAGFCGVLDILIHLRVKEPKPGPAASVDGVWERILLPLRNRDFRVLTLGIGVWMFGVSIVAPFGLVYLKSSFPVTYSQVALVPIMGAFGSVATSFLLGALSDRMGARRVSAILMVLATLSVFPWFFVDSSFLKFHLPLIGQWSVPQVLVNQGIATFFCGSFFTGVALCQLQLIGQLSPGTGRTMAMASHWAVVGLLAALGSLLGGWLMDFFTMHRPFVAFPNGTAFSGLHVLIVVFTVVTWFIAVPLMLRIREDSASPKAEREPALAGKLGAE